MKPSCVGGAHEGIAVWEGAGTDCKLRNLDVWEGRMKVLLCGRELALIASCET